MQKYQNNLLSQKSFKERCNFAKFNDKDMNYQTTTPCMLMVTNALKDAFDKNIVSFSAPEAEQSITQQQADMNDLVTSILLYNRNLEVYSLQQSASILGVHEQENLQYYFDVYRIYQVYLPLLSVQRSMHEPSAITNMPKEIALMKKTGSVSKRWQHSSAELMDICQMLMESLLGDLLKLTMIGHRLESETKQMVENQYDLFMKKNLQVSTNFREEMLCKLGGKAIDEPFYYAQLEQVYGTLNPELQRMARDYKGNLLLLVNYMQDHNTDAELNQIFLVYLKVDVLLALLLGKKKELSLDEKFIKAMNHTQKENPKMAKYTYIAIFQKLDRLHLMPLRTAREILALLQCCEIPSDRFPGKTSLKKLYLKQTDGPELVVVLMNAEKQATLNRICDEFVAYFRLL